MALEVTSYQHREVHFETWKNFLRELKRSGEPELLEAIFDDLIENPE